MAKKRPKKVSIEIMRRGHKSYFELFWPLHNCKRGRNTFVSHDYINPIAAMDAAIRFTEINCNNLDIHWEL